MMQRWGGGVSGFNNNNNKILQAYPLSSGVIRELQTTLLVGDSNDGRLGGT